MWNNVMFQQQIREKSTDWSMGFIWVKYIELHRSQWLIQPINDDIHMGNSPKSSLIEGG